jgi:hypothetical protein
VRFDFGGGIRERPINQHGVCRAGVVDVGDLVDLPLAEAGVKV